jgi:hypothetical protein
MPKMKVLILLLVAFDSKLSSIGIRLKKKEEMVNTLANDLIEDYAEFYRVSEEKDIKISKLESENARVRTISPILKRR